MRGRHLRRRWQRVRTEAACNPANGACETSNVADGTECDGGTCSGGVCVEVDLCEGVICDDENECTADACDPADGTCASTNVDNGTPCADETGMCVDGACMITDLCEGVVCDDTGNECTVAMCNAATGICDTMNVTDGTVCNGGAGAARPATASTTTCATASTAAPQRVRPGWHLRPVRWSVHRG